MSEILAAAQEYHRRGWGITPVHSRSKVPVLEDWTKRAVNAGEVHRLFGTGERNVGVRLGEASGGVADVDLDTVLTRDLAYAYLSPTQLKHGRESAPCSHWWYESPGARTAKFADPLSGSMLAEIRSDGAQTVVPPSVHPSGERIEWVEDGAPAVVRAEELAVQVGQLAAAALLAQYYPANGSRHQASLALAGMLCRAGWETELTCGFLRPILAEVGDEEGLDRLRSVHSTAERRQRGDAITGAPTLATIMPEAVVRKAAEWLGIKWGAARLERRARLVSMASVEPEEVRWLWEPYIPLGKLTLLEGDPGLGKTWLLLALAAAVSRGVPPGDPE